ncbi:MAG: carbon-nitrogen family hydrolase [Spirochaetia bacterium]|nr:carbon-nitrogen family hydrolase [Spirochaetia bacterium]
MKIALISLDQKWEDKEANLLQVETITQKSASMGAELVIFPEMTLTGFTMNTSLSSEEPQNSFTLRAFSEIAKKNNINMMAGLVLKENEKNPMNTMTAFSHEGKELARYYKIHPFSFAGEDKYFSQGNSLTKAKIGDFYFGFSICYDLRFPEVFSVLARDCEVLVNIANWPNKRSVHWKVLLQARAIENQCFMIAVNRRGVDGNHLEYERSSCIFDANGEYCKPIVIDGEIDLFNITREQLFDFRKNFSTRQDRRQELYKAFL